MSDDSILGPITPTRKGRTVRPKLFRRERAAVFCSVGLSTWDRWTAAGLTLYVAAAFLYIVALRRIPLSVALPCTAASYVAAVFVGHFLYDEAITPTHVAAVIVIGFGVAMLALAAR